MRNRCNVKLLDQKPKNGLQESTFWASVVRFFRVAPWRGLGAALARLGAALARLGEAISVPPGGVRGGKLLRGYAFHMYLSTGLTRRSLQRGGFNGYAVIPPTPL